MCSIFPSQIGVAWSLAPTSFPCRCNPKSLVFSLQWWPECAMTLLLSLSHIIVTPDMMISSLSLITWCCESHGAWPYHRNTLRVATCLTILYTPSSSELQMPSSNMVTTLFDHHHIWWSETRFFNHDPKIQDDSTFAGSTFASLSLHLGVDLRQRNLLGALGRRTVVKLAFQPMLHPHCADKSQVRQKIRNQQNFN